MHCGTYGVFAGDIGHDEARTIAELAGGRLALFLVYIEQHGVTARVDDTARRLEA